MREEWKQIEAVLDEKVRPSLRAHGGELEIDHLEDGVLYIKLLGQCAGCPSADLTNETLIEHELTAALPELVQKVVVVQTVSDELWEQAKRLLRFTDKSGVNVAQECGLNDANYFSRLFKKVEGTTPGEYRRQW